MKTYFRFISVIGRWKWATGWEVFLHCLTIFIFICCVYDNLTIHFLTDIFIQSDLQSLEKQIEDPCLPGHLSGIPTVRLWAWDIEPSAPGAGSGPTQPISNRFTFPFFEMWPAVETTVLSGHFMFLSFHVTCEALLDCTSDWWLQCMHNRVIEPSWSWMAPD